MIKVAFVTASLSRKGGGVSAVVESLSRTLVGIDSLHVWVFGLEDSAWLAGDNLRWKGAPVSAFRVMGPRAIGYAPSMTRALIDWAPDVVHTHGLWTHPARSVLQWAHRAKRPHVISPHGMLEPWALQNSALRKRLAGVLYENAHLRSAAALHALCEPEKAAIQSFGLRQPVHVIPNGIDDPPALSLSPAPWGPLRSSRTKVMLFLGRIHPKKNLLPFLEAWASTRYRRCNGVDWCLVIAGWDQGGYLKRLRAEVDKLQLYEEVRFLGPLLGSDKDAALRNASAFVLPSLSEGLPMAVLEAWSYRLPVLMTEACNINRAFLLGAAHRLDLDINGMAQELAVFQSLSPEALHEMGMRGQLLAKRDFAWGSIACQMSTLYQDVVNGFQSVGSKMSGCTVGSPAST